ncbi:MAG: hypothetical protein LBJ64_09270, partial [Deltaproteobacteria bacterium]|nr:hypothetical protein [Deltaproteobacteria bacterium]
MRNRDGITALGKMAGLVVCSLMLFVATGAQAREQTSKMSANCPTGGQEAEALYQMGRQYRSGQKGRPWDRQKAEQLFEQALAMGNAKAALAIGQMYFSDYSLDYPRNKRFKYMMAMYNQALKMGCPEAYVILAECYENGWGARENKKK